jgi:hypothetical protein
VIRRHCTDRQRSRDHASGGIRQKGWDKRNEQRAPRNSLAEDKINLAMCADREEKCCDAYPLP